MKDEKKKPGCLWRVAKFTLFALVILAVAGYFLCWYVPAFKLTPERIGWTLPEGVEVPLTADGKYVDHARAFELAYPEIYENPHKNGWRRVVAAVSPEVFRDEWLEWLPYDEREEAGGARWEAVWRLYCQRLDISPDEPGTLVPDLMNDVVRNAASDALIRRVQQYQQEHPEAAAGAPEQNAEETSPRLYTLAENNGYGRQHEHLKAPYEIIFLYENEVLERLWHGAWTPAEFPEVAAWLETQAPLLDVVAEAVREELYYPIPCRDESVPAWRGMTEVKFAVHGCLTSTLRVRSAMRLGAGDVSGAAEDLKTIFLLAQHCGRGPALLWADSWAVGDKRLAAGVVANQLSLHKYTEKELEMFQRLLETDIPPRSTAEKLAVEKVRTLDALQRGQWAEHEYYLTEKKPPFGPPMDPNLVTEAVAAFYQDVESRKTVEGEYDDPLWDAARDRGKLPRLAMALPTHTRSQMLAAEVKWGIWHVLSLPSFSSSQAVLETETLLARVGVAVERYRLKYGDYPPTLETLVPEFLSEVPDDPGTRIFESLTPQKLKYRVEGTQVVIYGVGDDLSDDGGVLDEDDSQTEEEHLGIRERVEWERSELGGMKQKSIYDVILRIKK